MWGGTDRATAKLEQHARPRRGGRGRRDSVNSRSPRDRGECSGSSSYYRSLSSSTLPPSLPLSPCMHASKNPAFLSAHGFHVSIIDDLIRNLLICACGGALLSIASMYFQIVGCSESRTITMIKKKKNNNPAIKANRLFRKTKNKKQRVYPPGKMQPSLSIFMHLSFFFLGGLMAV